MQVRNPNDDPTLFAPEPSLSLWRSFIAWSLFLPIFGTFMIGLPTLTGIGILWVIGGREYVVSVWSGPPSGPPPYRPPFLPSLGLIVVASIGAGIGYWIWRALFFSSGFIDEVAFNRYFDSKLKSLCVSLPALIFSGLVWLALVISLVVLPF